MSQVGSPPSPPTLGSLVSVGSWPWSPHPPESRTGIKGTPLSKLDHESLALEEHAITMQHRHTGCRALRNGEGRKESRQPGLRLISHAASHFTPALPHTATRTRTRTLTAHANVALAPHPAANDPPPGGGQG